MSVDLERIERGVLLAYSFRHVDRFTLEDTLALIAEIKVLRAELGRGAELPAEPSEGPSPA